MIASAVSSDPWVSRAERILAELDQQTALALEALARDDAEQLIEAAAARGRVIEELQEVMALVSRRAELVGGPSNVQRLAAAAVRTVGAHADLVARVGERRDALRAEIEALPVPTRADARYVDVDAGPRTPTFSMSG